MIRGIVKTFLALTVILLVSIAVVWYFWPEISPPVQTWIHDWLANPTGLTAVATVAAAIATFGAVVVGLKGIQEGQRQTREALNEGRRQFQESQYAVNLPLLVPFIPLPEKKAQLPASVSWNSSKLEIKIKNVGTGVALNVWGVLLPPEPMLDNTHLYSHQVASPLVPSKEGVYVDAYFTKGDMLLTSNDKIDKYTLCIPKERYLENDDLSTTGRGYQCLARLTLTYSDIFKRKHASIFDYTTNDTWVEVALLHDILQRLEEMKKAKESQLSATKVSEN